VKELTDTLASLVKPVFNGIGRVLTGSFGMDVAALGWLQVFVQLVLALVGTVSSVGVVVLFGMLVITQSAAVLVALFFVNKKGFDRKDCDQSDGDTALVAMLVGPGVVSFVLSAILLSVADVFVHVNNVPNLAWGTALCAMLQGVELHRVLSRAVGR